MQVSPLEPPREEPLPASPCCASHYSRCSDSGNCGGSQPSPGIGSLRIAQRRLFGVAVQHSAELSREHSIADKDEAFSSCSSSSSDLSDADSDTGGSSGRTLSSSSGSRSRSSSSCSEDRKASMSASVAASTAPSAAFCTEDTQGLAACAVHPSHWLRGKQQAATGGAFVEGVASISKLSPRGGRDIAAPAGGVSPVNTALPASLVSGVAAASPAAGASGAPALAVSTSTTKRAFTGLGDLLLALASDDPAMAALAGEPSSSGGTCEVQQLTSGAPLYQACSPGTNVHPASSPGKIAASAASVEAAAAAVPSAAAAAGASGVAAARAPSVADAGVEVRSAPSGSRLPSGVSDCVHQRSGTATHIETFGSGSSSSNNSSSSPSRLFRWQSGDYSAWTVGGAGRVGGSGGCSRGAGSSHCEMMQALKKQADLKASVDKAVLLFNKEGLQAALQWLSERKLIDSQDPAAVARFLYDTAGLDKKKVGEVLGGCSDFSMLVLQSFASLCDYRGLSIDEALRQFLSKFRPPGEAQQVYRLLYRFASLYVRDNQERGLDLDTVHFLAYAILMLHTDRHNPKVKRKMTKEQFRKIVAAGGAQLQDEVVDCMYDRVVAHEFRLNITESDRVYSRLVNDPRALRHLPGTFSRTSDSATSPTVQQQQQQQQRNDDCSGGSSVAAVGAAGEPHNSTVNSVAGNSNSNSSSGVALVSQAANFQVSSDTSAVLCNGEECSGNETLECMDTTLFVEGSVFVKLCRNGRMKRRLIRVTPDHHRLLWSPPNCNGEDTGSKQPPSSLPLDELVDITVGCLYTTAKKFDLTDEMEARCVSLQFSSRRLDLFAIDLSNATFARWISFFHQKVAQQQQQRQQQLRQQQQQMSQQKRLLLLNQSRAKREEEAAKKLELWRDEVLPFWESSWTCEAVPVAVPAHPSPLAVFVSFAASTTSALVRLPRSMILKHLNRNHRLGLLQRPRRVSMSLRRLRQGMQAGGTFALNLGRATTRQIRKLGSLPGALSGCTGSLALCSRETVSAPEGPTGCENKCFMGRRCRRRGSGAGGPGSGGSAALSQQTGMVGATVATEANAYIHLSHLGTTWVGRYSLDRGRRMDTATHPAFVRLWLGGLPGELRGKLWLIALGNEQNIGVPLLEALVQLGRLQGGATAGSYTSVINGSNGGSSGTASPSLLVGQIDEAFHIPTGTAASGAPAGAENSSSTTATGALDASSSCVSSNPCPCYGGVNPVLDALRKMPIRGVPYLMHRKVGEGPLLLTTALDELREEGPPEYESPEVGTKANDICGDHFNPVSVLNATPKKTTVGGPTSHASLACRTSETFVPVPRPRKQQQQHGEEPTAPEAAAVPNHHGNSLRPLQVVEQQVSGTSITSVGEMQHKKGARSEASHLGVKSSSTASESKAGSLTHSNSTEGLPLCRMFHKTNGGSLRLPMAEGVGSGPSPGGLGSSRTAVVAAEGPAPSHVERSVVTEGWTTAKPETNGGGEKGEMTIAEAARVLLEAYVLYRPDVGYVRGMDCLASMLLCFLPIDLAFVALANLLPAVHLLDFFCPALPCNRRSIALKFDFFESMLRLRLPHLYRHLIGLQVIPDLYLMRWMETLFCRALPFATLCRTWDGLLLMGEAYCFQVALGLLKYHESELLCNSFEGCLSILNRHAHPTADEDGTFDSSRFFKCVELCRIDSQQYGRWVANQRMSEEKAELLELVACSTV